MAIFAALSRAMRRLERRERHAREASRVAVCKPYGAGRVFYTALGHRIDVWQSEWFQRHVAGAISWALRRDEIPRRRAVAH